MQFPLSQKYIQKTKNLVFIYRLWSLLCAIIDFEVRIHSKDLL